ncbi:hypothetical protein [Cyclobacterium sp. SYSU L10401]|uniref:hypothetical protein n=1 Tax=Cyclobacterium sp. SYSU L10401 TaxID=2678657 RepID=UPI0013D445A6|nr:hypothetical protein [Cyclobacterium sp. SYSU L10401]
MRWLKWRMNGLLAIAILLDVAAVSFYLLSVIKPETVQRFFPQSMPEYVNGVSVVLASLSGVLFVYVAFLGQRWQMLFQQQEIRDNRKEIRFSTGELRIRIETLANQVMQMDGDVICQTFFRMLDHWCMVRDSVRYTPIINRPDQQKSGHFGNKRVAIEKAFVCFFEDLIHWVDDEERGWRQTMDLSKEKQFYSENGYAWQARPFGLAPIGEAANLRLLTSSPLTKDEMAFLIRTVPTGTAFDAYLRLGFQLFFFMMDKNLSHYLPIIEAGMGRHERTFLFYQLATQFEGKERKKTKDWLQQNGFLAGIPTQELLSPEHGSFFIQSAAEGPK